MLQLHVIEAKFGDCLLLEFGNPAKFILIDGGPTGVYEHSLLPEIKRIMGEHSILEALVISHVDIDHIKGVMELLAYLKSQMDGGVKNKLLTVKELWLNSFSKTIDRKGRIKGSLIDLMSHISTMGMMIPSNAVSILGIQHGDSIVTFCEILGIPLNKSAVDGYFVANALEGTINFPDIEFTIVGPTKTNLKELEKEWKKWLKKQNENVSDGIFDINAMVDQSIPNLSSICFLVKGSGKSILFTGDARGDHLLQGLQEKGLLTEGKFHCNILKVPHHGSKNNVDPKFFKTLTADTYVISADGKYDNPDYPTLTWIVEAAKADYRDIRLVLTNKTESAKMLINNYPADKWGYTITFIEDNKLSVTV